MQVRRLFRGEVGRPCNKDALPAFEHRLACNCYDCSTCCVFPAPMPPAVLSGSSEEAEVSVTPAPEGGAAQAGSGAPAGRPPLGSDDADMADDAVMMEFDAAEQLVSLSQLSLTDDAASPAGAPPAEGVGTPAAQQEQQPSEGGSQLDSAATQPPAEQQGADGQPGAGEQHAAADIDLQAPSPPAAAAVAST